MAHDIGAIAHLEKDEDVTSGIQRAVRRWSCNMMLMAWKASVERDAILSAPNRALAKDIDVDTLIFKEKKSGPVRRILVPFGGGNHALVGVQIAYDLARTWGAELEILRIVRDSRDPSSPSPNGDFLSSLDPSLRRGRRACPPQEICRQSPPSRSNRR